MTTLNGAQRILCAIDTPDLARAETLARQLAERVGGVKLGKEFFTAAGPDGVRRIAALGLPIFLDLKFHDIPNTVAGAVRAATALGCFMMTVHASGGPAMLRAAADAAADATPAGGNRPLIVGVTVLTSLGDDDLRAVGQAPPVADQVLRLARLAVGNGLDGVVASPLEAPALRHDLGANATLVVPGVRPAGSAAGDQKRVTTPADAVSAGADYLVIGRPITGADDPAAAADAIAAEIAAVPAS